MEVTDDEGADRLPAEGEPAAEAAPTAKEILPAVAALTAVRPSQARALMKKPGSVRQALLLSELLGTPVSMREGSTGVPLRPAAG